MVNLFQSVTEPGGATGAVDKALGDAISAVIAAGDFTGKTGEIALLYTRGAIPAARVVVVGLGEQAEFSVNVARAAADAAARKARDLGARSLATVVHGTGAGGLEPAVAAGALVEGTRLGLSRFKGYRPEAVVDIPTLTGAQAIALGPQAAARFANNDDLAARLLAAADALGEQLWRLPCTTNMLRRSRARWLT